MHVTNIETLDAAVRAIRDEIKPFPLMYMDGVQPFHLPPVQPTPVVPWAIRQMIVSRYKAILSAAEGPSHS